MASAITLKNDDHRNGPSPALLGPRCCEPSRPADDGEGAPWAIQTAWKKHRISRKERFFEARIEDENARERRIRGRAERHQDGHQNH